MGVIAAQRRCLPLREALGTRAPLLTAPTPAGISLSPPPHSLLHLSLFFRFLCLLRAACVRACLRSAVAQGGMALRNPRTSALCVLVLVLAAALLARRAWRALAACCGPVLAAAREENLRTRRELECLSRPAAAVGAGKAKQA